MSNIFICPLCKKEPDHLIVARIEECYYKYFPDTDQWKDFHGSESLIEQRAVCCECDGEVEIP